MKLENRYQKAKLATFISAGINSALAIIKIIIGYIGNSHALVADGLHSFSDLLSDGLVLIASKAGNKQPDKEHPYGHRRIETLASVIIALILIAIAVSIATHSITDFTTGNIKSAPNFSVLIAATISIVANEWLYRYTLKVGKKIESNLLITNAWHNRSDALTSIIVLVAAIGGLMGWHYLDTIGTVIIAIFILKMGFKMAWDAIKELIDTGVDEKTLDKITQTIAAMPGITSVHKLRTRMLGGKIYVDAHIIVDPKISVSEGHYISEHVCIELSKAIPNIEDVTTHIDPEDDELHPLSTDLPTRQDVLADLEKLKPELPHFDEIENIQLHYLTGKLTIDFYFPASLIKNEREIIESYQIITEKIAYIKEVHIYAIILR